MTTAGGLLDGYCIGTNIMQAGYFVILIASLYILTQYCTAHVSLSACSWWATGGKDTPEFLPLFHASNANG